MRLTPTVLSSKETVGFNPPYLFQDLRVGRFAGGYGVGDSELIALINRTQGEPFNVNRIGQMAAVAALADREHLARSLEVNRQGMEQISSGFNRTWSFLYPKCCQFYPLFDPVSGPAGL